MPSFTIILHYLLVAIEVLAIFNSIIIVHELGHFLAARWRGLKVEKFAIWFGKPLWSKRIGDVEYSIGSIPAGGFVALPQMAPMEAIEGKNETSAEALPKISALDKIIVAIAGPLFSLMLAFVFGGIVWVVGKPTTEMEATTTIGYVEPDMPAAKSGLQPGDQIQAIDGQPVKRWLGKVDSVIWRVIRSEGQTIKFDVVRDGKPMTFESAWTKEKKASYERAPLREVGLEPAGATVIGQVAKDSPAEKAGLLKGDKIVAVNGTSVFSYAAVSGVIRGAKDHAVAITIDRGGTSKEFSIAPVQMSDGEGETVPRIGVVWESEHIEFVHPTPWEQVTDSVTTMGNMLSALFSPKSDVKAQHFSGPVGVMNLYARMFNSDYGWQLALTFSVLFNVNLAILNMLPIPVLDGGHILLAIIESIRRKPVSPRFLEWASTACALFLFGFMLYVTFYDAQDTPLKRLFRGGAAKEEKAVSTPVIQSATTSGSDAGGAR